MERSTDLNADEQARRDLLMRHPVIAVVGRSDNPTAVSYEVAQYLEEHGFTVYSVNPRINEVDGKPSYASLKDIPAPVDIVDVFRNPDVLPEIVDEAIAIGANSVWGQLGVTNDAARAKALAAGLNYADGICIRAEHKRQFPRGGQG